jgi:DNA modification methylase
MPWRLAFALQADGWYLRQDIIWHKPNPMPESVRDRCTKAHEYLFLLAKGERYYFDLEAIREPSVGKWNPHQRFGVKRAKAVGLSDELLARQRTQFAHQTHHDDVWKSGRNKRTVWTIPPRPFKGAHFATFPPELPAPCIQAGTSEQGCCPACGAPWRRLVKRHRQATRNVVNPKGLTEAPEVVGCKDHGRHVTVVATVGWQPTCPCGEAPTPCTVLDPFAGSGTTGLVCRQLGRAFIGIELNPSYCEMAQRRIAA